MRFISLFFLIDGTATTYCRDGKIDAFLHTLRSYCKQGFSERCVLVCVQPNLTPSVFVMGLDGVEPAAREQAVSKLYA